MTVTAEDVRRLLEAGADAVLVMVEGRVDVVEPAALDTEQYRGALQVTTRDELIRAAGAQRLSDRDLTEQAAALDSAVSELGG